MNTKGKARNRQEEKEGKTIGIVDLFCSRILSKLNVGNKRSIQRGCSVGTTGDVSGLCPDTRICPVLLI
jgi:hypothetical protein